MRYIEIIESKIPNDKDNCWIAPNGKIHWCDFHDHGKYSEETFGKTEYELENNGYMKVSDGFPFMGQRKTSDITWTPIKATRHQLKSVHNVNLTHGGTRELPSL